MIPALVIETGACDFCGSHDAGLVDPADLRAYFELVAGVYIEGDDGTSLPGSLRRDWGLFGAPSMTDYVAQALLSEIFDDAELLRKRFVLDSEFEPRSHEEWDVLRSELMHENRWFLQHGLDLERLGAHLSGLRADPMDSAERWFRARLVGADGPFEIEKLGAPPPRLAGQGRANPAGIPYLYLASDERTAVSEVRPHTGDVACVAEFEIPPMTVVDLRAPRELVSPFLLGDRDEVGRLLADIPLLEKLGDELTRPVLPRSAPFEYTPSQFMCEFIKSLGFDGVLYRSSVGEGVNLALFYPGRATGKSTAQFAVSNVSVEIVGEQ